MEHLHATPQAIISIITGILILIFPRLLSTIVALYLILFGVLILLRY